MTRSLCMLLVLSLSACHAPKVDITKIPIAEGATFALQAPADLKQSISLEQIVDARFGDRKFSFHCLLEVDPQVLVLVGMTPMNTRAFTVTLRGRELSIELAPGTQLPVEPARILADLQLALWPDPQVAGLVRISVLGYDSPAGGIGWREFQRDKKAVIRVYYDDQTGISSNLWGKRLIFQHLERDYELDVRTVHAEKLEP